MIYGLKKVVAFFAHTDDEFICAGTLHRLVRQGCDVSVVTFGPAAIQGDKIGGSKSTSVVLPEWDSALDRIGISQDMDKRKFFYFCPSSRMHERAQDIADIAFSFCDSKRPDAVFTLSPEDENPAHRVVGEQCERVTRGRVPIHIRCQFPWNYGLGRPNLYVSLSEEDLECKAAVIDCYKSQAFRYNYREMLMSYARADGLSVKVPYAEKFELIRGAF